MNKRLLYLKQLLTLMTASKIRLVLIFAGVFAGIFLLSLGNLLISSYYDSKMADIMQVPSNVVEVYVSEELNDIDKENMLFVEPFEKSCQVVRAGYSVSENRGIFVDRLAVNPTKSVNISLDVCFTDDENIVFVQNDNFENIVIEAEIIKGRGFSEDEIKSGAPVIIIDEASAFMLFGEDDPIGQTVDLGNHEVLGLETPDPDTGKYFTDKNPFTVIGVYKNNLKTEQNIMDFKSDYYGEGKYVGDIVINSFTSFASVPYNAGEAAYRLGSSRAMDYSYVYVFENEKDADNFADIFRNEYSEYLMNTYAVNTEVSTRRILTEQLDGELAPLKLFLNAAVISLIVISGICNVAVVIFNTKERFTEIGIRKTYGAGSSQIICQIILENLMVSVVASVFAVIVSILAGYLISGYIQDVFSVLFDINVKPGTVLLPLFAGAAEGIVFGLIPAVWASKAKIADILKFE